MTDTIHTTEQQLRSLENSTTLWKVEKMISLARRVMGPQEPDAQLVRWAHEKMQKAADGDPGAIIFLVEDCAAQKISLESSQRRVDEALAKVDKIQMAVIDATIEFDGGCSEGKMSFLESCQIYPGDSRIPTSTVTITSTVQVEVPAFLNSSSEIYDFVVDDSEIDWESGDIEVETY